MTTAMEIETERRKATAALLPRRTDGAERAEKMYRMRKNGMSFEEIGEMFGFKPDVAAEKVYQILKKRALERSS